MDQKAKPDGGYLEKRVMLLENRVHFLESKLGIIYTPETETPHAEPHQEASESPDA